MKKSFLWAMLLVTMALSSCSFSDSPSVHDATVMAQKYIRSTIDPDCDFETFGAHGEQTAPAHYRVQQPFFSSVSGRPLRYEYKAVAIYLGGDKRQRANWVITDVTVDLSPFNNLWGD